MTSVPMTLSASSSAISPKGNRLCSASDTEVVYSVDRRAVMSSGPARCHRRDPGLHLAGPGGVNPKPRSRLPNQLVAATVLVDVATGGIGRAAGLTPFGVAETICGQRG